MPNATPPLLLEIADALKVAADREDWEEVETLFRKFQGRLHDVVEGRLSRAETRSALDALNEAIGHAQRRRDEIRGLIEKLSDQPL